MAKPLVDKAIDHDPHLPPRGSDAFLPCRAAVVPPDPGLHRRDHPPPPPTDRFVLAQAEAWAAGPAGAGLPAQGETFAELAAGFGVGTATAWRYVTETVALLAARSHRLGQAQAKAKDAGHAYQVIDGTLIPIDRVAADQPFYTGKHRKHGMNLQVIASPGGDIVWVPGPLPGAVHDLTAARIWGIIRELAASGLITLGDKGYVGEEDIRTPYRGRNKPALQKDANRAHDRLRAPGECANAQLKSWRIFA